MKKNYNLILATAGVLMAVNGQAQWIQQTSNTTNWMRSIYCTDANTCYASGTQSLGYLIKTSNGGTTWAQVTSFPSTSGPYYSLFFSNTNEGYAAGAGGYILYTPDAGNTWNQLYLTNTTNLLYAIHLPDNSTAYAVGINGTIIKSTTPSNQFGNWAVQTSGTTKTLRSVHFVNPNIGFAVGDSGTILKTINGGTNWNDISYNTINPLYSVKFINQDTGYAVGGDYAAAGGSPIILKTTDGGTSWTSQTLPPNPTNYDYNLYSLCFDDADTVYAVGYIGIILKTTNGGSNWIVQNSTTTSQLWSAHCINKDTVYAVGLNGTIVKTVNGGNLGTGIDNSISNDGTIKFFPNPFSHNATLSIEGTDLKNAELAMFNLLGENVKTMQDINSNQLMITRGNLPSGMYFYEIRNNHKLFANGKFIIE